MLKPNTVYAWELETADGVVIKQYDEDGKENTWKSVNADAIVRFSFVPSINILPRHDVLIDHANGERFVKRFGRGIIRQGSDGIKLREYINCCMTNRYRLWVFSTGRTLLTRSDYEVRI